MNPYQPPPKDPNEDYIVLGAFCLAVFLSLPLWILLGGLLILFFKALYPFLGGDIVRFLIGTSPFSFFLMVWLALIVFIKGWFIPWWRLRNATKTIQQTLKAEMIARTGGIIIQEQATKKKNNPLVLLVVIGVLVSLYWSL